MTGRKRKASFVAKQRKEMVGDLEKVQYDDVVETAIERLQAGPHLERYKSRNDFVRTICHEPAKQTLVACIMGIILAFLDIFRSCMKGRKGKRFANFEQRFMEHIKDYVGGAESETGGAGSTAALTDTTERQRLWSRVTAAASAAGSTLAPTDQRIIVSTLCYIVYDLMVDKIKHYKVDKFSEDSSGASTSDESIQLREHDVNIYRYGSFALHSMLKKRRKATPGKLKSVHVHDELQLLECMRIKDERWNELPIPIQQLKKRGLHMMRPEMLPFLRNVVEAVGLVINDDMRREHGHNMITEAEKQIASDHKLQSSFQTCVTAIDSKFTQECLQCVYKELTAKIFHARINEYMSAAEEIELEQKGKAVKVEQSLRDQLKTFSGLKGR
jgi:hypothetical protein